jgi:hypothetical protein
VVPVNVMDYSMPSSAFQWLMEEAVSLIVRNRMALAVKRFHADHIDTDC